MDKPAWWPNYEGQRLFQDREYIHGWEDASDACWKTFCDWLDACQEHHFDALKAAVEKERYPEEGP